jgi:hypothetical protein
MGSLLAFIAKPKNREILSWVGGGIVTMAVGAWAVVTYVWPADESPSIVCAQGGSIAAGRDASSNTINYNGNIPAGAGSGAAPCADAAKK